MSNISDEMMAGVGQEYARCVSYPISESDIRRWAIAVYWPNEPPRIFWDAKYAAETAYGGIVAPEEFNPFAWKMADSSEWWHRVGNDPEGYLGIKKTRFVHAVNGGIEAEYGVRMRPGDVITALFRLDGYEERRGRAGPMLFTTTEDTWTNQNSELVKRNRLTIIWY